MLRILQGLRYDAWQVLRFSRKARGPLSVLRYVADLIGIRWRRLRGLPVSSRESTVFLRGGVQLTYRSNWGDLQSLREVWLDECYRLPFETKADVLVDLGANIGLTSVWLMKHYGFQTLLAVEPSPANARLVRRNLADNAIDAEVIEAAIGPRDGVVFFQEDESSNLGRVADQGRETPMISMPTLLSRLGEGATIDVVKLDIEGGEGPLLAGDLSWTSRVRSLIAEMHPGVIDYPAAVAALERAGYRFIPPHSVFRHSTDAFVSEEVTILAADA